MSVVSAAFDHLTRTGGVIAVLLARVAPKAPDAVVAIALALDTDNPEAHESVVDAALARPNPTRAR